MTPFSPAAATRAIPSRVVLLAAVALAPVAARAAVEPVALQRAEPRVVATEWNDAEIVRVRVPAGGTQFVFSPAETKFDVSLSDGWDWDVSHNTLVFKAQQGAAPKVVFVVSAMPDQATRRYQVELTPANAPDTGVPWQGAPAPLEASAGARTVSDATAAPAQPPAPPGVSVVRFTYARADAEAKSAAARAQRAERVGQWRARQGQAAQAAQAAQQAVLRAEVQSQAGAQARRRCDAMWRGERRLVPRAVCNTGAMTTFLYAGMDVPALFAVGPDGKDVKVQQEPVAGQPGLILVRATSEFWRARLGEKSVAEFYDAAFDPMGGVYTGTDTASPNVRMVIARDAVPPSRVVGGGLAGAGIGPATTQAPPSFPQTPGQAPGQSYAPVPQAAPGFPPAPAPWGVYGNAQAAPGFVVPPVPSASGAAGIRPYPAVRP